MKKLVMAALGALMMAGTTAAATTPAEARVVVGIGFGGNYYPSRYCDPYSRWYNPYRCDEDRYYGGSYYYDPIYFGGYWHRGPFRYRHYNGHREFWVRVGWHRNEWNGGGRPGHMRFRDGWHGGGHGSWSGHGGHGGHGGGHHH